MTVTVIADDGYSNEGSATVTINPPLVVSISPTSATVTAGTGTQSFTATVTGDSANAGVTWTLGGACTSSCGTITSSTTTTATYAAPAAVPSAKPSLIATSIADPLQTATAQINVTSASAATIAVAPATASVQVGTGSQSFTATVANDSKSTGVSWALSGTGCTAAACGSVSPATSKSGTSVTYTPPSTLPSPATVTLTATSIPDSTVMGTATITLTSGAPPTVVVAPSTASVQIGTGTQSFTATITNDQGNNGVNWTLSGAGCSAATCGTVSPTTSPSGASVTYSPPATLPSPATVTLTATSQPDGKGIGTAGITLTPPPSLTISPSSANVQAGTGTAEFTATLTNDIGGTGVKWSLSGGCSGSACGSISPTSSASGVAVTYTPPPSVTDPLNVAVTAISQPDNLYTATAMVTVSPATVTSSNVSRFLYTPGDGKIFQHTIDHATGQIRFRGYLPISSGNDLSGAVSVSNSTANYVYAVDPTGGNIYGYAVSPADGTLTAIAGTPVSESGLSPLTSLWAVTVKSSSTTFIYTLASSTYQAFKVAANGSITAAGSGTFGEAYTQMVFDPAGQFAYVAQGGEVNGYSISATDGTLTALTGSPFAIGSSTGGTGRANPIAVSSAGFFYLANLTDEKIYTATIGATGALSQSASAATGSSASWIAVDQTAKYLFVANLGDSSISAFTVNSDGSLNAQSPATVATAQGPSLLAIDPSNSHLYASEGSETQMFPIGAGSGALGTPLVTGENITAYAFVGGADAITYAPSNLYVAAGASPLENIDEFGVSASNGTLTSLGPGVSAGALNPIGLASDVLGQYLFLANTAGGTSSAKGSISAYTINGASSATPGQITAVTAGAPFGTNATPNGIAIDGSTRFLYVTDGFNGSVLGYSIGAGTGTLTPLSNPGAFNLGGAASVETPSSSGASVFIVDMENGGIAAETVGNTGTLSGVPEVSFFSNGANLLNPVGVAVDPTDRFVYVVANSSNNIEAFTFTESNNGTPLAIAPFPAASFVTSTGKGPTSLAIDPAGHFLYVANGTDQTISIFKIDAVTGVLTASGTPVTIPVPSPVVAGQPKPIPTAITIDPSGQFLYVANNDAAGSPAPGTVSCFTISSDGSLTVFSTANVKTDYAPSGIVATATVK